MRAALVVILGLAFATLFGALAEDQTRFPSEPLIQPAVVNVEPITVMGDAGSSGSLREILDVTCEGTIASLDDDSNGCLPFEGKVYFREPLDFPD